MNSRVRQQEPLPLDTAVHLRLTQFEDMERAPALTFLKAAVWRQLIFRPGVLIVARQAAQEPMFVVISHAWCLV
jgi:hypothetical protein